MVEHQASYVIRLDVLEWFSPSGTLSVLEGFDKHLMFLELLHSILSSFYSGAINVIGPKSN
jgi:hypothetical protein